MFLRLKIIAIFSMFVFVVNAQNDFKKEQFDFKGKSLKYGIYMPEKIEPNQKYDLVLFLHGAGARGHNYQHLDKAQKILVNYIKNNGEVIFIAPQCPHAPSKWVNTPWGLAAHVMPEKPSESMALTFELLNHISSTLPINTNRMYITGLSMGGFGTWDMIQRKPKLFAAAIPICGGGDTNLASRIKDVPIWVFHGDKDNVVKTQRSRDMVKAIINCGGKPKYTECPGIGHHSWDIAYDNPETYKWLYSQEQKSKLGFWRKIWRKIW